MAEKISDSIKRNLKRLRKALDSEPSKPSSPKEGAREQRPPPSKADRPAARENVPETSDATPEKKKTPAKPWYHHRQRW
jgi:hypothetical protein